MFLYSLKFWGAPPDVRPASLVGRRDGRSCAPNQAITIFKITPCVVSQSVLFS
jgi:hypothetical protein